MRETRKTVQFELIDGNWPGRETERSSKKKRPLSSCITNSCFFEHAYSSIHLHANFWLHPKSQDIFKKPFHVAIGTVPEANLIVVSIKPSKGLFFLAKDSFLLMLHVCSYTNMLNSPLN